MRKRYSLLSIGLACCLVWLHAVGVAAERAPSVILARFPFSNQVPNGSWSPFLVKVENPGSLPRDLGVAVTFPVGGQGKEEVSFSRNLHLPPHTSRLVESFVLLDYPPSPLRRKFDEKEDTYSFSDGTKATRIKYRAKPFHLQALLVDIKTGEEVSAYSFLGMPMHPDVLVLGVSDGVKELFQTQEQYRSRGLPYVFGEQSADPEYVAGHEPPYAGAFLNKMLPSEAMLGRVPHPVSLRAEELPTKWAAYEGVGVLLLGSLKHASGASGLTPQQRHSLLRYVRSGGRVVVMPTHGLDEYLHPFWRQLLPVRIIGSRAVDADLVPFGKRYGGEIEFDHTLPPSMVEAIPGTGEVLLQSGERVLLARRTVGSGQVWFLAVAGEVMADWSQSRLLWADILRPLPDPIPGVKKRLPPHAKEFLSREVGIEAPARGLIVVLLAAYFFVSTVALLFFRWRGRAEWGWTVVLAASLVCVTITFILKEAQAGKIGFVVGEIGVSVLENGQPDTSITSFVGILSPSEMETDLRWTNPDTLATLHPSWDDPDVSAQSLRVEQANQFTFRQVRLQPLRLLTARTMTMARYGDGIALRVGFDTNGLNGFVENRTGLPLSDCMLRLNRRCLSIGSLKNGERYDFSGKSLLWGALPKGIAASDSEKVRRYILAELFRQKRTMFSFGDSSFSSPISFYGWADIPQAEVHIGDVTPRHSALQLLVAPARRIAVDDAVLLPAGVCGLRLLRGGSRMVFGDPVDTIKTYSNIRWPEKIKIAGSHSASQRKDRAASNARNKPHGMVADYSVIAEERPKTPDEKYAPTTWASGVIPSRVRVAFDWPAGMEPLNVTALHMVFDVELRGMNASLSIRKPGEEAFTRLKTIEIAAGAVRAALPNWKQYCGSNGALPEFELWIRKPAGSDPLTPGWWRIRQFDIEITGQAGK